MVEMPTKPHAGKSADYVDGYNAGIAAFLSELKGADTRAIPLRTLKWWRELVDLNPSDLAPRLDAVIAEPNSAIPADEDISETSEGLPDPADRKP